MSGALNESMRARLKLAQEGDLAARDALVRENLPLVRFLVRRFLDRGKEYDDLYQHGCLGLLKAIERFDLSYDVAFSTYAVPVIIGEMRRYLRDDNPLHVARSIAENARKIETLREERRRLGEEEPTVEGIGRALDLTPAEVVLALNVRQPVRSLNEPVGGNEDILLQETIGNEPMAEVEERLLLHELIKALPEKERALLIRRYYLSETQTQIAREMGMTQVQVSRMEKRILAHMRQMAGEQREA